VSLRIAVIGAGHLGRIHTRLLKGLDEVQVVGVVDPDADARQRSADEFDVPGFEHHSEVVSRIDAALVAATTDHHHSLTIDLLKHDIDVFVEKPLAGTLREADEMATLAAERNCILQVGHVERFNAAWTAVVPFVRRPRYVEAVRTSGFTFRSTDIGVVLDLMIHDLDLVLSIVRSEVVNIDAMGTAVFGPHEDMAHAHLHFANGAIANLNTSRTSFQPQRSMQIVGERAYATVDFGAPSAKIVRPSKRVLRREIDVHQLSLAEREQMRNNLFTDLLPVRELPLEPRNAILDEQREFVECVRTRQRPQVGGPEARRVLDVAEKILAQINTSGNSHGLRRAG
jgi:predicted dehydrogenase